MGSHPLTVRQASTARLKFFTWAIGGLAIVATSLIYAYCTAFSYFSAYDDEGYALIGVRGFLDGHRLYTDIFTFYGPFYFFYEWVIHSVFTIPLNHDATTILCVLHWLLGSAILATVGFLLTRSMWVACLVFMQMSLHLTPLAREPGHPQELAVLLLSAGALIAAGVRTSRHRLLILAAMCPALIFTKINIGMFYGCALLLMHLSGNRFFKVAPKWYFLILGLSASLPFLLMKPNLHERWAMVFSSQSCITILAAGTVSWVFGEEEEARWSQLLHVASIMLIISVALVLIVVLKGASFSSMVDALVRQPAKLGSSFSIPLKVPGSLLSAALAALTASLVIRSRGEPQRFRMGVAFAKGAFSVIGIFLMVTDYNRELGYLLPWSWLLLVPSEPSGKKIAFGRVFICLTAVWQSLQAYPVAGTQVVIGTLLLPVAYGVCLHDAITILIKEPKLSRVQGLLEQQPEAIRILGFAVLFYVFIYQWCDPRAAWRYYSSVPPLGMSGAARLRLPEEQVQPYGALVQYLKDRGEAFYTLPGFNSLYFWTGMTPPTYLNVPERLLLNDEQQQRVISSLESAKHSLIVINENGAPLPESVGPLALLIHQKCHQIAQFGMFRVVEVSSADTPVKN